MSRIRADQLVNRAGSGGPKFPNGVAEGFSVSGVVTATQFKGDGSQLSGIDASSLKDGSDVKVQATATGATITGDISATNATFSGNLTVQGTTTTIDTAVTAVDSLAVEGNVGIGTTNPQVQLHLTSADPYIRLQDTAAPTGYSQIMGTHQGAIAFSADTSNSVADSHLRFDVDGTERLRISSNGALCIGSGYKSTGGGQLTIRGLGVNSYSVQDYQYVGTPSDGNTLAQVRFTANTSGTNVIGGARIQAAADADWSATGDAPTRLQFFTCADASASQTERLRITSGGHILPGADNTQDLGSSSKRFANIYTGDLNLSNEGSANDVDGTWGQYTIQEGEDDLFLINRRTGKKYKFNLTEVN